MGPQSQLLYLPTRHLTWQVALVLVALPRMWIRCTLLQLLVQPPQLWTVHLVLTCTSSTRAGTHRVLPMLQRSFHQEYGVHKCPGRECGLQNSIAQSKGTRPDSWVKRSSCARGGWNCNAGNSTEVIPDEGTISCRRSREKSDGVQVS